MHMGVATNNRIPKLLQTVNCRALPLNLDMYMVQCIWTSGSESKKGRDWMRRLNAQTGCADWMRRLDARTAPDPGIFERGVHR